LNDTQALPVRDEIRARTGNALVDVLPLDLSSLASVRAFADTFRSTYRRLNVLINNAGILSFTKGFTEDGFEQTVGVNYLGPFLLTSLLLPLFSSGEDNRIINLTSMVWPLGSVTLINELMQRSTDWVNIRM
jgi:NAD(P)-dependent dehydrogenase (short-subunit alcohol dehydrogenase family)